GVRRLVRPPTGSSFPSGHAAVGAAVMTVLADSAQRRWARTLLHGLGAYVGWSRVFVGVHYPTDVLGGAGLGLALGSLWRGPVAALGRRLLGAGVTVGRGALPPLARAGLWAAFGVRSRRRRRDSGHGRDRAAAAQAEALSEAA
ncbi:MAG TPA: phosphatase PAP2 family protein, partial [Egibacteraceae bacterium]